MRPSIHLFVCSSVRPLVSPCGYSVIRPVCPSIYLSIHPSVYPSVYPSVHPSVRLSVRTSNPPIRPSLHASMHACMHPTNCPSIRPSVDPSGRSGPVRSSVHPWVWCRTSVHCWLYHWFLSGWRASCTQWFEFLFLSPAVFLLGLVLKLSFKMAEGCSCLP